MGTVIAVISAVSSLAGLVVILVKTGIDKGDSDRRIKDVEKRSDEHTAQLARHDAAIQQLETGHAELKGKLSTDIEWIKETLTEIKTRLPKE